MSHANAGEQLLRTHFARLADPVDPERQVRPKPGDTVCEVLVAHVAVGQAQREVRRVAFIAISHEIEDSVPEPVPSLCRGIGLLCAARVTLHADPKSAPVALSDDVLARRLF